MDRGLDEIISSRQAENRNRGGRNNTRKRDVPRESNRKSGRDVANLDSEWIHDKYEDDEDRGSYRGGRREPRAGPGRYRDHTEPDPFGRDRMPVNEGTKIEIMNLHWDITDADLELLVEPIGPTSSVKVNYDDTHRSTGRAEVVFDYAEDARTAVAEFDGANAKGQPIRVRLVSGRGRNPLDRAVPPVRSLLDRVDRPGSGAGSRNRDRDRSRSPGAKRAELRANPREDIDRYVPADRDDSRPRRRSPRRGGDRRDSRRGGGRSANPRGDGRRGDRSDGDGHKLVGGRPRMTQEELDRDMDNYFNKKDGEAGAGAAASIAPAVAGGDADIDVDIDMAE